MAVLNATAQLAGCLSVIWETMFYGRERDVQSAADDDLVSTAGAGCCSSATRINVMRG
jgi:hypothetical protein